MNSTPASLLERLREPDADQAWRQFVALYTPLLYFWARRLNWPPGDAADLVQEVLTTLVRKMPEFSYDANKSFRGWLRTVTLNVWRQAARKRTAPTAEIAVDVQFDELPAPDTETDFAEDEYRRYLVGRALELMQSEFQANTWRACWASIVDGRPAADVAQELGMTPNAVYLAKARVLRRLYEELNGLLN
jgi:RNA polymerase sigma-70 factor (ECF subfamily)